MVCRYPVSSGAVVYLCSCWGWIVILGLNAQKGRHAHIGVHMLHMEPVTRLPSVDQSAKTMAGCR